MLTGTILSVVVGILLYALAIWVVGKLGLGLKVSGFVPAIVAAIVIAVVSALSDLAACRGDLPGSLNGAQMPAQSAV